MSVLVRPKQARRQRPANPQIDRGHHLAKDLAFCIVPDGLGAPVDLVTGRKMTPFGTSGQAMTELGPALKFDGSTTAFSIPLDLSSTNRIQVSAWFYAEAWPVSVIAELTANYNLNEGSFGLFGGDGGFGSWTTTNYLTADTHEQSPSSKITADGVTQPSAGRLHHIVAQYTRDLADNNIWIDGILQASTRPGTTNNVPMSSNFANSTLYVGARAGTGAGTFLNGRLLALSIYRRSLRQDETQRLYTEPFVFLQPQVPRQRYWLSPGTVYYFHHSGSVLAPTTSTGAGHSQRHAAGATSTSTVTSGAGHAGHHSNGTSTATTTTVGTDGVAHRRGTGSALAAPVTSGEGHGTGHGSALATTVTTGAGHSARDGAGATVTSGTTTSGAGHSARHGVGATVTDVTLVHGAGITGRGGDGSALLGDIITGSGVAKRHGAGSVLLASLTSGSGRSSFSPGSFAVRSGRLMSHGTSDTGRLSPTPHRPSGVIVVGGSE